MSTSGNNEDHNPTRKYNNEENPTRKGKGRRKVPMAKMENEANLQITFSKRRNGLFKKASEISTRCGAESAIVVFSPGGKPFSFGHPNVERVISRFLDEDDHNSSPTPDELIALENERHMIAIANANAELNRVVDQMNVAKNQAKELEQIDKQLGKIKQIKDFNYHQLYELKGEVLDFKNKLGKDEAAKHESFTGTPYTFLGQIPNLGTATDFQLVQPTGSSFDPRVGSNLPGFSDQVPYCFGSGVINLFGSNVPLAPYYLSFAGTTSTTNFSAQIPVWNASSSSFVIPYTPLSTNPTAAIPINSTEDESSGHVIPYTPLATNPTATIPINSTEKESSGHVIDNNVSARKDRDEYIFLL